MTLTRTQVSNRAAAVRTALARADGNRDTDLARSGVTNPHRDSSAVFVGRKWFDGPAVCVHPG